MTLAAHLATLEAWDLIQPVVSGAQVEYRFRHALVHEAAYSTLLRQNRRTLHQAVGEVLEANPAAQAELAPVLAFHFSEAGDSRRASRYFALAGRDAARKFAHREAVSYYTQAISALPQPPAALLQARGQVYELQGFFDEARQDYERSAEVAHAAGDLPVEWQAILRLGLLWSARDYDRSGEYAQMAFELAEQSSQPRLLAHSYNRLGNWHVNVERPREAVRCHNQALALFESLHDDAGRAETLDLLGMTSMMGGDLERGGQYYQQAIELNRRLGNQLALANCLGSQVLTTGGGYQTMMLRPGPLASADFSEQGEQALRMTHEIGWRDGEAFINMVLSNHYQAHGQYAHAIRAAQAGLAIAGEIGHQQWLASNHYALALTHYDILDLPGTIELLETGLALSRTVRTQHWTRCHIGLLTLAYVESGALERAEALQMIDSGIRQPPQSIGERLVIFGRASLARAHADFDQALANLDSLLSAAQVSPNTPARFDNPADTPSLILLFRGRLYAELGQLERAEADFRPALAASEHNTERPLLWRLHQALGLVLGRQGRPDAATQELAQARTIVEALAGEVPDAALRANFRARSGLFGE